MKILHTSDWHLGRSLYGRKRYEEFSAFLQWLMHTIEEEQVEVLLVAGDVFDTSTPSNRAQELYYDFLCRVANSCCRHVVIIAGNHDSPTFLRAPKELLRMLHVHVIGAKSACLEDEVITLYGEGRAELLVCAVPYLRDRDIRCVEAGESIDDKNAKLVQGLQEHYAQVCALAQEKQGAIASKVPIIAMGHLFTTKGKTMDGDGVRELYVGSLAHVGKEIFPSCIDYLALGHLHIAQTVGGEAHMRYSGSPLPMGFGEAKHEKKVVLVDFTETMASINEKTVPCFQELLHLEGNLEEIQKEIQQLAMDESTAWLEIEYKGTEGSAQVREVLEASIAETTMEILRIKNTRAMEKALHRVAEDETLDDLTVHDVFNRCLDAFEIPLEERTQLIDSYNEIIQSLDEADTRAE